MREIKFRGRRLGQWYYGDLEYSRETDYTIIVTPEHNGKQDYHYRVERETVGQYTGLKDKNGREIYEGDVVRADGDDNSFAVSWDERNCFYAVVDDDDFVVNQLDFDEASEYEVIGNIHDNPKMLQGNED